MNIILVGMMGSGKSSVGRVLADSLGRPFVDTDEEIEALAGMPIPQLFATQGEAAFRALETHVITRAVTRAENQVIATGGGAVVGPVNRLALREGGTVFWLDASPQELFNRAQAQGLEGRPLLTGADPLGRLGALLEARRGYYGETAHHRIETTGKTPHEVAGAVLEILKETT